MKLTISNNPMLLFTSAYCISYILHEEYMFLTIEVSSKNFNFEFNCLSEFCQLTVYSTIMERVKEINFTNSSLSVNGPLGLSQVPPRCCFRITRVEEYKCEY